MGAQPSSKSTLSVQSVRSVDLKRRLSSRHKLRTHPLPQVVLTASKLDYGLLRQSPLRFDPGACAPGFMLPPASQDERLFVQSSTGGVSWRNAMPFCDDYSILIDYINPLLQKRYIPIFFSALSLELRISRKACGIAIVYLGWFPKKFSYLTYVIALCDLRESSLPSLRGRQRIPNVNCSKCD